LKTAGMCHATNAATTTAVSFLKDIRSHLINAATQRKRQDLGDETVETQPNHHFPSIPVVQVLWHSCHETIYEISSSID
jgi:hypothetical protein